MSMHVSREIKDILISLLEQIGTTEKVMYNVDSISSVKSIKKEKAKDICKKIEDTLNKIDESNIATRYFERLTKIKKEVSALIVMIDLDDGIEVIENHDFFSSKGGGYSINQFVEIKSPLLFCI